MQNNTWHFKILDNNEKKYEEKKFFDKNNNFTARDELQLTCLTLNSSIKSNYFSLNGTDTDKLLKIINETMVWLLTHQNEESSVYNEKILEISEMCNSIYHNMNKIKILENIIMMNDEDDENDENDNGKCDIDNISQEIPERNKINENIDSLLEKLPDKLIKKNILINKERQDDILLKIDMNKLNSNAILKYKNTDYHYR